MAFSSFVVQFGRAVPGAPDEERPDAEPPGAADEVADGEAVAPLAEADEPGLAAAVELAGAEAADDPPEPGAALEPAGPHPAVSSVAAATAETATAVERSGFREM